MAGGVEELLELLYELVDEAKGPILSPNRCTIERDKALDLLDDIRSQFPVEFSEARKLIASRNDYLASAKREAELIRKQAQEQAAAMIAENELMMRAKSESVEMVRAAESQARELRRAANEYCDDAMRRAEDAMEEAREEINRARNRFRAAAGAPPAAGNAYDVSLEG